MHLRRAILLFALVLGLTALATAIAPTQHPQERAAPVQPSPDATPVPGPTSVRLHAPAKRPSSHRVAHDARVVVQVEASEGGQVDIPKLGELQALGADSTVQFDLLDLSPGRYDILFEPALGVPARIGTLVSR